jgi:hypothetical protein
MATSHSISRRKLMAAGAATATSFILPQASGYAATSPVLVELFTSQGCSSCPPADEFAGDLIKDPRVVVLSFNVDYWDYIGWRDTLAKPEFSQRQYDYARARGDGKVYTPQMVINGSGLEVGSNRSSVLGMIREARNLPAHLTLTMTEKEIRAEVSQFMPISEATLWLMAVEEKATQEITRGENAGKTITYHNVVRNMVPAAMWKGEALGASWMRSAIMPQRAQFCVAVLQKEMTGPVLGIARTA